MRKWMSERLKRRKKPGDDAKEAAKALEPLQPKFYDNEPAARVAAPVDDPVVDVPVVQSRRASKTEPEASPESDSATGAAAGAAESRPRLARRRRSRGGRGRSRAAGAKSAPVAAATSGTESPAGESSAAEQAPAVKELASSVSLSLPSAPASSRPSKGTVVLAIGLPGSGKSSWFKRHNIHPLSSDLLRELLFDDAQEQRFQDLVFSNLRSMLKARLIARRPLNYVDATNLTPHDRSSWIKLAKDYGYDVQGVYFDVPLEVCMERHQRRGRAVPEDIMRKMAGKLKAPTFDEGFSKITVVRVKQKEAAAG
jgi:predicted kinase